MNPGFPTHDESTGAALLDKAHLEDGAYYVGRCRNASVARWNSRTEQFYYWRQKFDDIFIETIKHPVDEEIFDVFRPIRKLSGHQKFPIPFDEMAEYNSEPKLLLEHDLEVWCTCKLQGTCIHCKSEKTDD